MERILFHPMEKCHRLARKLDSTRCSSNCVDYARYGRRKFRRNPFNSQANTCFHKEVTLDDGRHVAEAGSVDGNNIGRQCRRISRVSKRWRWFDGAGAATVGKRRRCRERRAAANVDDGGRDSRHRCAAAAAAAAATVDSPRRQSIARLSSDAASWRPPLATLDRPHQCRFSGGRVGGGGAERRRKRGATLGARRRRGKGARA